MLANSAAVASFSKQYGPSFLHRTGAKAKAWAAARGETEWVKRDVLMPEDFAKSCDEKVMAFFLGLADAVEASQARVVEVEKEITKLKVDKGQADPELDAKYTKEKEASRQAAWNTDTNLRCVLSRRSMDLLKEKHRYSQARPDTSQVSAVSARSFVQPPIIGQVHKAAGEPGDAQHGAG